jgi:tetratricopeptide (TPR) repeat protein
VKLLMVGFLIIAGTAIDVRAQNGNLPPPKPTLVTVYWPDLNGLEKEVREHLLTATAALIEVVKNPASSDAILSEAYGTMGQTYHAYSLSSPATECYVNASRLAPRDFRWIYLKAKLDHEQGRVDDAIKGYLVVRNLQPDYVAAAVNLGNIYLDSNRLADARTNFTAALQIRDDVAAAHYGLGQVALSERNYQDAVKHFEKTLALLPAATRTYYSLAMAYRGLGELEKAKASLSKQGTVGVRSPDPLADELKEFIKGERLHLVRGRLAVEARQYAEAAAEFRKAIEVNPQSTTGRINLGAVLTQLGDSRGAVQQFEEVLRLAPENPTAHYNLAVLLAAENRNQEAIEHLRAVLKLNPNDEGARRLLARLLQSPQ